MAETEKSSSKGVLFRSVFAGIGYSEFLADFLHKVVVDVGVSWNGNLFQVFLVHEDAVAASFAEQHASVFCKMPYQKGSFHASAIFL